jgi:RNA polymerase sigma factor (sigma-70 family)
MSKYNNQSNHEILTNDETLELIRAYKENDCIESRNKVINSNTRMVLSITHKFGFKNRESFDDLYQEGIVGLIWAIDRFDVDRGSKFSVFAYRAIRGYMLNQLNNRFNKTCSLSGNVYGEDSVTSHQDRLVSEVDSAEDVMIRDESYAELHDALEDLSERDRKVVIRYFGLGGGVRATLEEIGDDLNITKQGTRAIIERAKKALKSTLVG